MFGFLFLYVCSFESVLSFHIKWSPCSKTLASKCAMFGCQLPIIYIYPLDASINWVKIHIFHAWIRWDTDHFLWLVNLSGVSNKVSLFNVYFHNSGPIPRYSHRIPFYLCHDSLWQLFGFPFLIGFYFKDVFWICLDAHGKLDGFYFLTGFYSKDMISVGLTLSIPYTKPTKNTLTIQSVGLYWIRWLGLHTTYAIWYC